MSTFRSLNAVIGSALLLASTLLVPHLAVPTAFAATTTATAAPCTLYAAPAASAGNSGTSPSSPLPLREAAKRTTPGAVVCLLAGTYELTQPFVIPHAGSASAWITYRSEGGTARLVWDGSPDHSMVQVNNGTRYIEIEGLEIDGRNRAGSAIKCGQTHHVRAVGNTVVNTGGGGIVTKECDYMTVDRNLIHHTGYTVGWSSGVSLNMQVWSDQAPGFHNFVTNNIVAGAVDNSDHHTDGNGIILDRGGNMPPTLVANNLVYMNGGKCINIYRSNNAWVVNNTCYKNALDSRLGNPPELTANIALNVRVINNIVSSWKTRPPYQQINGSTATFNQNTFYGTGKNQVPWSVLNDPNQLRQANPDFVNPFHVDPTADGQWNTAPAVSEVGNRFQLRSGSAMIDRGVDPRSMPGLSSEMRAGMGQYLLRDLAGNIRPQGAGFDLGAYEYAGASSPTPAPSPSPTPAPSPSPTPAPSASPTLPGRLEAEDYRAGSEGVGYHDTTTGNRGTVYRTDNVDIKSCTDGAACYNVGWIAAGEWLAYDVDVEASGSYVFTARVATTQTGRRFHIEVDGVNVSGPIAVPVTGDWNSWGNATSRAVNLTAGRHTIKLVADTGDFNLNFIAVN